MPSLCYMIQLGASRLVPVSVERSLKRRKGFEVMPRRVGGRQGPFREQSTPRPRSQGSLPGQTVMLGSMAVSELSLMTCFVRVVS